MPQVPQGRLRHPRSERALGTSCLASSTQHSAGFVRAQQFEGTGALSLFSLKDCLRKGALLYPCRGVPCVIVDHRPPWAPILGKYDHLTGIVNRETDLMFARKSLTGTICGMPPPCDRRNSFYFRALRGFVWVDASAKMPTWQRRHSRRVCLPDQARGASEEEAPARRGD